MAVRPKLSNLRKSAASLREFFLLAAPARFVVKQHPKPFVRQIETM
jgi:hypothetical protein